MAHQRRRERTPFRWCWCEWVFFARLLNDDDDDDDDATSTTTSRAANMNSFIFQQLQVDFAISTCLCIYFLNSRLSRPVCLLLVVLFVWGGRFVSIQIRSREVPGINNNETKLNRFYSST